MTSPASEANLYLRNEAKSKLGKNGEKENRDGPILRKSLSLDGRGWRERVKKNGAISILPGGRMLVENPRMLQ